MDTMSQDLRDVVYDLVNIGKTWGGDLPPEFGDTSIERRLRGAAFSILVLVDGDSGPGPVRLTPKNRPDEVDLGGQALHEVMDSPEYIDDPDARRFVERVQQVTGAFVGNPPDVALKLAVGAVCQLLADDYELNVRYIDEDGYADGEGENLAPGLPAAFKQVWESWSS